MVDFSLQANRQPVFVEGLHYAAAVYRAHNSVKLAGLLMPHARARLHILVIPLLVGRVLQVEQLLFRVDALQKLIE